MKLDWCIHYSGCLNDKCNSGHRYLDLARPLSSEEMTWRKKNYPSLPTAHTAISRRVPCGANNDVHTCTDFRLPTKEQVIEYKAKSDAFIAQFMKRMVVVRPAIEADIETRNMKKRSCQGIIDCPACAAGKVHYSYAGNVNGHIHARCTTKGCVEWME